MENRDKCAIVDRYVEAFATNDLGIIRDIYAAGATVAPNDTYNNLNWGSNHAGGAMFSKGDGSVEFVSESVSMDVFMAAGSRNSGEPPYQSRCRRCSKSARFITRSRAARC